MNKTNSYRPFVLSALILNFLNAVLVLYCLIIIFFSPTTEELKGVEAIKFFTFDSAIFSAVVSVICIFFDFRYLLKRKELPFWLTKLKYTATSATTLTFLIVVIALFMLYVFNTGLSGTELGYNRIVSGTNLFMHIICPILTLTSFYIEPAKKISKLDFIHAYFPMTIYMIFYLILALLIPVSKGGWGDIYSVKTIGIFNCVIIAYLVATLSAFILTLGNNLLFNRMNKMNKSIKYNEKQLD